MSAELDRRSAIAVGAAALLVAAPACAARPGAGILLFDPASAEARRRAAAARGQRLIALIGDPIRLWRGLSFAGPVSGLTSWSDYLILRGLAEEAGLRLRREDHHRAAGQPLLVSWACV